MKKSHKFIVAVKTSGWQFRIICPLFLSIR